MFSQHFSSVFHHSSPIVNSPIDKISSPIDFNTCILSLTDIYNELHYNEMKTNPDPDNISSIIFTECKFVLSIS